MEDLVEPDNLAIALNASTAARLSWDRFPPSARKQMLWWVLGAAKAETRAQRITTIVAKAAIGERAQDEVEGNRRTVIEGATAYLGCEVRQRRDADSHGPRDLRVYDECRRTLRFAP